MIQKTTLKSLLCLTLLLGLHTEKANAQWSPVASMPGGPMDECFSFSLHGKGYVGGGSSGSHFYRYDTTTNTWTLVGNAPGNKWRGAGFSFVVNNKGYAGCGDTTDMDQPCADMWMFNDTTNTWTQKASFPGGGRDALFGFAIGDTAYVGSGFGGGFGVNDFYKYNPFTDTWTSLGTLPFGSVGFAASFVIGNKGYIATGQVGASESTDLWEYNPATNTWTAKASYPGPAKQSAFGFAINNYGYVGGGMSGYTYNYYDMWRYDPVSNTWTAAPAYTSRYPAWATAFTVGNTAYVGTGTFFDTVTVTLLSTDSFKRFRGTPTTGIGQAASGNPLNIYPNPASDYFSLLVGVQPGTLIHVYDLAGREVKTFSEVYNHMDIADLPEGVYVVKCICTAGIYTEKLVKK